MFHICSNIWAYVLYLYHLSLVYGIRSFVTWLFCSNWFNAFHVFRLFIVVSICAVIICFRCPTDGVNDLYYVSDWLGKRWPMVACPFGTLVVLYRMFTFIMCLIWLIFGILFLHLSTSVGCFCPRKKRFKQRIWWNTMGLLYLKFAY